MDLADSVSVVWASISMPHQQCIVHMVDVNIFEYFNMPESIRVGGAEDGYKNSKRIWSYTIYFHCISIKRYSRRYLLSNIWLLHAGFCPLKPSSQRLQRFHSVFFFHFRFSAFSVAVFSIPTTNTLSHSFTLSLACSIRLIRLKTCIAILK